MIFAYFLYICIISYYFCRKINMDPITLSIPVQVNRNVTDAYAESLKMILQHVADFHLTVVDIISEKYNIPVDDMMSTVTSDSRYINMLVDPKIHHFTSLNKDKDKEDKNESCSEKKTPVPLEKTTPKIKKTTEKKIKIKPKVSVLLPETKTTSC